MIIVKKIKMIRYISRTREAGKEVFDNPVWCLTEKPPDVPYYKIKVKIIATENRYGHERKNVVEEEVVGDE